MSSRGSKSKNGHVTTNEYHQVGEIRQGAKVLEGNGHNHGLPDYSHSPNSIYVKLDKKSGKAKQIRQYDENGYPVLEIGYHTEKSITGNRIDKVLHTHEFGFNLERINWKVLNKTDSIYNKYKNVLEEFGL